MSDAPSNDKPGGASGVDASKEVSDLERLRRLLMGPEQDEVRQLHRRLEDPKIRAQDISRVLPEAIVLRSSQDKQIARALEPITEESIKASIRKNRSILVEALFPVMGPAIRKAITSTIRAMISLQS